jgi:hypothetical protein
MSDDLLRDALADAAATIAPGSVRSLTAASRPRRRWAIPVGVATAAALALAVTATVIRPAQPPAAPRMTLAAYAGAKYVLVGGMPPGTPVSVNNAATGKEIARVPIPRGTAGFWDAAGTGDNRTFLLTTVDVKRSLVHFHRLRLSANGIPEQLSELPKLTLHGLPGEGPRLLAATNGGTKLAYVTESGAKVTVTNGGYSLTDDGQIRERITVIDLATGNRRAIDLQKGSVADDLTWTPDGRHLVFTAETPDHGLRILDPATGAIRPVELGSAGAQLAGAAINPDGTQIVALVFSGGKSRLVWYSLASEKIIRDLLLGSDRVGSSSTIVFGNTIVAVVGDHFYQVTGSTVLEQRVRRGVIDFAPGGTW